MPNASSALASLTPPRERTAAGLDLELDLGVTSWPGFSAAGGPAPRCTWPAITAAAARVRDSNSPRSANRESRRTRATGTNGSALKLS